VRTARSSRLFFRFSPNPGAFTAHSLAPARSLLMISVASACAHFRASGAMAAVLNCLVLTGRSVRQKLMGGTQFTKTADDRLSKGSVVLSQLRGMDMCLRAPYLLCLG